MNEIRALVVGSAPVGSFHARTYRSIASLRCDVAATYHCGLCDGLYQSAIAKISVHGRRTCRRPGAVPKSRQVHNP